MLHDKHCINAYGKIITFGLLPYDKKCIYQNYSRLNIFKDVVVTDVLIHTNNGHRYKNLLEFC